MLPQNMRPPWTRPRHLLVCLTVLGSLLAGPAAASTIGPATDSGSGALAKRKPTIVLVHGAWADGSSWRGVVTRLRGLGYPVRVPPVALRSVAADATSVADFVSTIKAPIVLVGHSYGGAVITTMGATDPDVRALVFVNAFAPDEGEVLGTLPGPKSALAADPTTIFDFVPHPAGEPGDVDLYLKKKVFVQALANDLPKKKARTLWTMQRPITGHALNEPSGEPAWQSLPSWYALGTRDLIIPRSAQRSMAERANSTIVRIKAGHLAPIARPAAVAAVIDDAAR